MRGNEGRIPATVKMPGKENISSISLRPNEEQVRPKRPLEEEESSGGGGELIKKAEETGDRKKPEEVASEESKETEEEEKVPTTIKENISVVIRRQKVPTKQGDPGMFTLPISIGNNEIAQVMCDLGASINVLPLSVYQKLSGVKMVNAQVVIQLADCSCIRLEGIVENIIVKVHNFIYPVDFYVIRTGKTPAGSSGILLERPFLKTAKTIINMFDGTLCLEYYREKYMLSLNEAKKPTEMEDLHSVEDIAPPEYEYSMEELLREEYNVEEKEKMEKEVAQWNQEVHTQGLTDQEIDEVIMDFCLGSQATWSSRVTQSREEESFNGWEQPRGEKRPLPLVVNSMGKKSKRVSPCPNGFHPDNNGRENLSRLEGVNCNKEKMRTDTHIYKIKSSRTVVYNLHPKIIPTPKHSDSHISEALASQYS
ncbi:hypothetical protein AAHA92_06372 [Salvia divinorum]|uniref:Aspartic peptidase DDI1-type domain-containing protein n=1 Tax=Salvia divinorum TaxID=28513 RepID=A0ABD1I5E5_SALDI